MGLIVSMENSRTCTTSVGNEGSVELRAVTVVYGSGGHSLTALDEVSVEFPAGTFSAIMGPSGSGKSTLLLSAAGLEKACRGEVFVAGVRLGALDERQRTLLRRDHVGFAFQSFNLVGSLTAAQNVELPLRFAGRRPDPDGVRAALDEVGLSGRAGHRPSELSGGQQQRVALARALISRPSVVFADEPTGALDTKNSHDVLRRLRSLVDRHAQTVVMVTHDPAVASYADSVVFLADGRVVGQIEQTQCDRRANTGRIAAQMTQLDG